MSNKSESNHCGRSDHPQEKSYDFVQWNDAVKTILNQKYYAYAPYEPNLGQKQYIEKHTFMWRVALLWMLKIEGELKLRIPINSQTAELIKPHGTHLHCIYVLCKESHAAQPALGYDLPYKHASEWFHLIYKEIIYEVIVDVLRPTSPSVNRKSLLRNGEIKRHGLRELNDSCTMVANYENPFRDNPGLHNLSSLLDAAIQLAEIRPSFQKRYFKPYIKSWRALLKAMGSPEFTRHWVEDGEFYCQSGSGRRIRNITQENRPRIPLRSKGSKNYQQLFQTL